MAKIHFTFPVKYNKVVYGAYQPFEVAEEDVALLVKQGGILMETPKNEEAIPAKEPETKASKEAKPAKGKGRLSVES